MTKEEILSQLERWLSCQPGALAGLQGATPEALEQLSAALRQALDLPGPVSQGGIEGVALAPGRFTMGGTPGQGGEAQENEGPAHQVTLTRRVMAGLTQVTQAQYEAVTGANPSNFKGADRPVENVSWYEAVRFCNALSEAQGLAEAYTIGEGDTPQVSCDLDAPGYRLPTEAEWEYAARAGLDQRFAGGDELDAVGWHHGNSDEETQPVAQKAPNRWGLYDMSGNVYEWCWDGTRTYSAEQVVDPVGPTELGAWRADRGGSWFSGSGGSRVSARFQFDPGFRGYILGFRLFRTLAD